ncbi:MAG: S8 family peptidase [Clostridiales bacterium]|jgi:subtilisin family serine protease|nr:S8 family peptidase [Clostridiales bacterium]
MSLDANTSSLTASAAEEFITSRDTAAVIIRRNDFDNPSVKENPNILLGKVLNGTFMVAYARNSLFRNLLQDTRVFNPCIGCCLLGVQDLDSAGITMIQQQPYLDLRGSGVLLGFVDTGIDYTQQCFRYENGETKIKAIWDQNVPGHPPKGYLFGTEYESEQINAALGSSDPLSQVATFDESGHGTFLASIAASRLEGDYRGVAPDAELVVVKLRETSIYYRNYYLLPLDQRFIYESADIMQGIEFLIETAKRLGRPIAICIGLGGNFDSHDGFSVFEEYITSISYQNGVAICCAAGNSLVTRRHYRGKVESAGQTAVVKLLMGENGHSNYIAMWNNGIDRLSVGLVSPTGERVGRVAARSGTDSSTRLIMENSLVSISYVFPLHSDGSQLTKIRLHTPTPGIWQIEVYGEIVLDGTFDMWAPLRADNTAWGEFVEADPHYTITIPGTAMGVITCGAHNSRDKSMYQLSSWGPTRLPMISPDMSAPGVEVGGIFPNGPGAMSGTSVSAAYCAGACALLMQWGLVDKNVTSMNTYHLKSLLIQGCDRDTWATYPNDETGYGRLNLYNTFTQMRYT